MSKKLKREDPQEQFEDFYDEEDILESDFEIEEDFESEYRKVRDIIGIETVIPTNQLDDDGIITELEKLQEKLSMHKMMVDVPLTISFRKIYQYITEIILEEEVPVEEEEWIVFDPFMDQSDDFSGRDDEYHELDF